MAQACRMEDDAPGEAQALDRLLALQPTHLGALLMKGAALARAGDDDEAMAPYQASLAVADQARR
ncbi:MAG: aspartyl/asparaginyl beta-hydroxylase domain-containing protein, partial [Sphingomicrobium sp.]